jgi:hypothetical protein
VSGGALRALLTVIVVLAFAAALVLPLVLA